MITVVFIFYVVFSLVTIYLLSRENEKKDLHILDLSADTVVLRNKLKAEEKLNADIKARFVRCNTCTAEMKDKCLMWSENLCNGERCDELVDIQALMSKDDLTIH